MFIQIYWVRKIYEGRLKNLYDDVISAVNDFVNQWVPNTATVMEELCVLKGRLG